MQKKKPVILNKTTGKPAHPLLNQLDDRFQSKKRKPRTKK
jgi:hypothetical protein